MRKVFKEMFGELTLWGKFWMTVGLLTLLAAAAMSFDFGYSVSAKHALFLGCLSIITAFAPEVAYRQWQLGKKGVGLGIALFTLPWFAIEFYSHAGYTAGLRGSNISEAHIQNASWNGAQEGVTEDKTNRAIFVKQLDELLAKNAWAGTVKAEGLRTELRTIQDRIEQERNGKRGRKAGCGAECERLQNAANDLSAKIATIEKAEDLTRRIEATQRVLDNKREVATKTEYRQSTVDHQNAAVIKWVALAVNGSTEATKLQAESAQQIASFSMALAGTCLPAFSFFLAGLFRKPEEAEAKSEVIAKPVPEHQSVPSVVPTEVRNVPAIRAAAGFSSPAPTPLFIRPQRLADLLPQIQGKMAA